MTLAQALLPALDVAKTARLLTPSDNSKEERFQARRHSLRNWVYLRQPSLDTAKRLTKNSIWLLDLGRDYPHAKLDGFDISTAQYPNAAYLPKNVTLGTLDLHKPIPKHLQGQYDIVHVGLLVLVVQRDDPSPIIDNLLTLLS